ncbi:PulJ/GspJ family protein [Pseudomonas sp. ICMP 561]|uniref:PulJ/GspJ family protein n=1 Tax=Pseudomonas sp. ICMP 561 TaxID=1718918 RepID=UPI000C086EAD|nr:prepilin-type N-terminal cleavage/methylation domain-containing protein [Pseudomonas sp. ICMP 561]PHN17684.1 type II secretion pathway protein XcpW [Pseudomonas sp. ICMP 561]
MRRPEHGLTLVELLVAMALTAVLGVMLAALVNGWLSVRERLAEPGNEPLVLEFCLALERRLDGMVLRQLYEQRLPLPVNWLDWKPAARQLEWVALTAWPDTDGQSRLQRQRLEFSPGKRSLEVSTSGDLYAASVARWQRRERLDDVDKVQFSFFQGTRWLAFPSSVAQQPNRGVRLEFERHGAPYVCTFNLPDSSL